MDESHALREIKKLLPGLSLRETFDLLVLLKDDLITGTEDLQKDLENLEDTLGE